MARKNYCNNEQLYQEMVRYLELREEAVKEGAPIPPVTDYIGECIKLICTNLTRKPRFSRYTYKEDMIGDAMISCLKYLHNFDYNKYTNPFTYFTTIAWNAFTQRLEIESGESYVKFKSLADSELCTSHKYESKKHINLYQSVMNEQTYDVIRKYEEGEARKKAKQAERKKEKALKGLEGFME